MGNSFMEKPTLAEVVIPEFWDDEATGLSIPLDPMRNLQYRLAIMEAADRDLELQAEVYALCGKSIHYWINTFVFTVRVFQSDDEGVNKQATDTNVPFCLWPEQSRLINKLYTCISEGKEILVEKSRDVGCSWLCLTALAWFFLFRPNQSLLMLSRKEDSVDMLDGQAKNYPYGTSADVGTLFGKLDAILSRLPEWMLPRLGRKSMHLVNLDNKSRIDGESSNASAGSSDRRTAILLDEMAKMAEGESIKRSTRDVTACRIAVSTPNGAGTAFSKWRLSGQIDVFPLMWYHCPDKARGLYAHQDTLGKWSLRSKWYDREKQLRSPKELAIEVDSDHIGSGDVFFEPAVLDQHTKLFARPPRAQHTITFKSKLSDEAITKAVRDMDAKVIAKTPAGPLKLWVDLIKGRPDQSKTYIISIDISKGQGASNSVMSVGCVETREKVAEWCDANTPPYELARLACALAIWVGGRGKRPLVIYENNGDPGLDFGRQFVYTYRYPNVYFDKADGTLREKVGKRHGFRSSPDKKAQALGLLRRAYAHGKYINRSAMALQEATTYIHYEGGGIGPAELVNESTSTRKAHGDRVVADFLFIWAMADAGRIRKVDTLNPNRSFAKRFEAFKRRKKGPGKGSFPARFNFAELPK